MPECDVLLVQCAVSLARAPKSREVYDAMKKCQAYLKGAKGPLPSVPLHLRNAPTALMKQLGLIFFILPDLCPSRLCVVLHVFPYINS